MKESMLYELVKQLEKDEIRQFKKYVRSPVVTHRKDLQQMFDALSQCLYRKKKLPNREELFELTFPQTSYDNQKLRNTMSDLHQLIEDYLIWSEAKKNHINSQLSLATIYRQRNLPKHFQRTIKKVEGLKQKQVFQNSDSFQNLLTYQIEKVQFQLTNSRAEKLNLQEIDDTIDILYLSQKLRHVCTQLSHRAVFKAEYQFGLMTQWIDQLEDSKHLHIPAIALYYYCYRFLTQEYSQQYFRKFRTELSKNYLHFPKDELKNLYRAALNFCIRKLNEGNAEFTQEGWELYQEGLRMDVFLENNRLSRFTFDNIVGFGLRVKAYDQIDAFIESYQQKLSPEFRENTVFFNLARLEYNRKNYSAALDYIQSFDPKDLVNKLIIKTLQLKIYYDSDEMNLLESHLDNFRLFIHRKEVSNYHRQNFQKIIFYTRKLIALAPYDGTEWQKLYQAISNEPVLTEKNWFLEKLS